MGSTSEHLTIDALYNRVALDHPGFAGVYQDGGVTTVLVSAPRLSALSLPSAVRGLTASLVRLHGPDAVGGALSLRLLPATFSFDELYRLKLALLDRVMPDGVTSLRIADRDNVVAVYALDPGASDVAQWAEAALAAEGLPPGALEVRQGEPAILTTSLQDRHESRYLSGGARIGFFNSDGVSSTCTLGFNALLHQPGGQSGIDGFVTNAHCTGAGGLVEDKTFYQPTTEDRAIGTEILDPPFLDSSEFAAQGAGGNECPRGSSCRYSDSAFIRYDVDPGPNGRGASIFKTTGANNRSLEIQRVGNPDGSTSRYSYFIVADESPSYHLMTGQTVNKIGQTTGWTRGEVTTRVALGGGAVEENCEQIRYNRQTDRYLVCQAVLDLQNGDPNSPSAGEGDSGAAVFTINSDGTSVRIRGLLWGGATSSS